MATSIAITAPMKKVPQKSGTAPRSSPISDVAEAMVSGVQLVPNRKSMGLTIEKNRADSKISEAMMPTVVTIATNEASSKAPSTIRSIRVRAGKPALTRVYPNAPPASAAITDNAAPIQPNLDWAAAMAGASCWAMGFDANASGFCANANASFSTVSRSKSNAGSAAAAGSARIAPCTKPGEMKVHSHATSKAGTTVQIAA